MEKNDLIFFSKLKKQLLNCSCSCELCCLMLEVIECDSVKTSFWNASFVAFLFSAKPELVAIPSEIIKRFLLHSTILCVPTITKNFRIIC